jgi:hypothetical protein
VPAEQRLGPHEERRPAPPRQGPREPGQQRPIGEPQLRPGDLATEHGELVAQARISTSLASSRRTRSTMSSKMRRSAQ